MRPNWLWLSWLCCRAGQRHFSLAEPCGCWFCELPHRFGCSERGGSSNSPLTGSERAGLAVRLAFARLDGIQGRSRRHGST
jgi:hypothetical protein